MAARGGRVGMGPPRVPIGGKPLRGEEEEEEKMEIGVCFYRGVSFSFLGAVAMPFFWENLGKTLRPARRVASRHPSALLRACPVGFINPLPPSGPGQLQGYASTYLPYSALPVLLGIHHSPHLFLELYRALERLAYLLDSIWL